MEPNSVGRFPLGLLCMLLSVSASGMCQALAGKSLSSAPAVVSCPSHISAPTPAFPSVVVGCDLRLEYLGVYNPDGQFKPLSKMDLWSLKVAPSDANVSTAPRGMRPAEVPPALNLRPIERVVDDYEPAFHAKKLMKGETPFGGAFNSIVTFVYGHEQPLLAPQHVTTDSRGRLIASDPAVPAVHVLDGKKSFRIVGGAHRRLQQPNGIAVDADGNIYVADSKLGLVLVYDPLGRYLHTIGRIDETETFFHHPTGIAIDRAAGRLYVADAMRERVFVLDLHGNVIDRFGIPTGEEGAVSFDYPTDIALGNGELIVLDQGGSRIQVVDLQGRLRTRFVIGLADLTHKVERGLAVDSNHNVYVSNLLDSAVRIYNSDGKLVGSFGRQGPRLGEFNSPEGLWVDSQNKVFIADTAVHRIQVFRLNTGTETIAGTH